MYPLVKFGYIQENFLGPESHKMMIKYICSIKSF